jgi:hypothetical protein
LSKILKTKSCRVEAEIFREVTEGSMRKSGINWVSGCLNGMEKYRNVVERRQEKLERQKVKSEDVI